MKLFNNKLEKMAPKWNRKDFVEEQLLKHLSEVEELITAKDAHALSECIDLANIVVRYIEILSAEKEQLEGFKDLKELVEHRYNKFLKNKDK